MHKHLSYRNYSKHTVTNYVKEMNHLCCYFQTSPNIITEKQIESYLYYLFNKKKYGPNKINLAIASFTYFYCNIVRTPEKVKQLRPPRIPNRVPFVLAPTEVFQFIESLSKFRDKVIIQLLYSTGIRVGECVNLKRHHINKARMTIRIDKGKGQKDRYVPLSPMMLEQLEAYYEQYKPKDFIFYARSKEKPMCRATVNRIIRNANGVLKTKETITPHTFRHSFATMLTEEGENLFAIQKILGHKSFYSTLRYMKSAKTELKSCVNPLDKVYEDNIMLNLKHP
ncbi:MAG: tyrosine-type recombinase/integrase [Vicingaceae bacterium]